MGPVHPWKRQRERRAYRRLPSGAKLLASDTDYEARTFLDPLLNTRRLKFMSDLSGIPVDGRGVNHCVQKNEM